MDRAGVRGLSQHTKRVFIQSETAQYKKRLPENILEKVILLGTSMVYKRQYKLKIYTKIE